MQFDVSRVINKPPQSEGPVRVATQDVRPKFALNSNYKVVKKS